MSLGLTILLIVIIGYASNWLNWRYLNHRITRYLYYIGALVHESSHAIGCLITGAKIREFSVFSAQPHVTHDKSRLPIIGNLIISSAPIVGGLAFLYLINVYLHALPVTLNSHYDMSSLYQDIINIILNIYVLNWKSWIMIALFINIGAMLGPSPQDVKNMWLALVLLFFVSWAPLLSVSLLALKLMVVGVIIQIGLIVVVKVVGFFNRRLG